MALKWLMSFSFTQVVGPTENLGMVIEEAKEGNNISMVAICKDEDNYQSGFQLPRHYPNYSKKDYEKMEEWKLDMVLKEYGLSVKGSLDDKRDFAIGSFLWPNQL